MTTKKPRSKSQISNKKDAFVKNILGNGYKPLNLVTLHGAGRVLKPSTFNETPWWTEYPETTKTISIDGACIASLATTFGLKTYLTEILSNQNEPKPYNLLSGRIPLADIELEFETHMEQLFGKIESGVLHLIAFIKDQPPEFSTHSGGFDVSWQNSNHEDFTI